MTTLNEAKSAWENKADVICKGCGLHIYEEDNYVELHNILWHKVCADEDKRINNNIDFEEMRYDGKI